MARKGPLLTVHRPAGPACPSAAAVERLTAARRSVRPTKSLCSAIAAAFTLAGGAAVAADGAGFLETLAEFDPYASIRYVDDSNLLRKSDAAATLLGIDDTSDRYLSTEAGFATELQVSRQRFQIDGRVYHNAYDRFDAADHTGGDARGTWFWLYGPLWEGELQYRYKRKLRGFENQGVPEKDMISRHEVNASAMRRLTPRWRVGAEASWADIDSTETETLAKTLLSGGTRVDWTSPSGNVAGLRLSLDRAEHDRETERDYDEWFFGPDVDWRYSPKTRILAWAGYKQREHEGQSQRDFDGFVGRAAVKWRPTVKTLINATVERDITNLEDEISEYAVMESVSLEPIWDITPKTTLRGLVAYSEEDYRGGAGGGGSRVDDIRVYGLWLDWNFTTNSAVSVGVGREDRRSNRSIEEYDSDYLELAVRVGL
jgi:hypothetical protein